MNLIYWQNSTTPAELRLMLKTLGGSYPIQQGTGHGITAAFEKIDTPGVCEVRLHGKIATIIYSTPAQAGRAIGALLGRLVRNGRVYRETTPFSMLGIMLDCSRNAVMTVDHVKLWLRRLSLLGYNVVMLYTEETYELPGEPYFGYQRGAYTLREIKAIDAYAARLNIEIIPCIQTLGHLAHILKHPAYETIRDTQSVMLVGKDQTYTLIEKMIDYWRKACRTDRIHIGMDETNDLGRGRYMNLNGYRHGFDLFNEHLTKVVKLCTKHNFKPIIWSDMYFRFGCKSGLYYDEETVIPKHVVDKIPKMVELVYWDYHHRNKEFYFDWINRHRKLGKEPLMGSGIWTWDRYWYDYRVTESTAGPCIDACYEAELNELFFTQWGDNGAYCDHDSAFAGMVFCADKSYGIREPSKVSLEKRFAAVCGGSYAAHMLASDIHGGIEGLVPDMWDDPFFETKFRTWAMDKPKCMAQAAKTFASLARKLKRHQNDRTTGDLRHAFWLAKTFADRYALSSALLKAYRVKDKVALRAVRRKIPGVVDSIRTLEESFRTMWLNHNKPEGLETIQSRFGMIEVRYREMSRRLTEYLSGKVSTISELDCKCPPK